MKRTTKIMRCLVLLVGVGAAAATPVSSSTEIDSGSGESYYKLYEDSTGRPWCGGSTCSSGLCCRITAVQIP